MFIYFVAMGNEINVGEKIRERIPHLGEGIAHRECLSGPGGERGYVVGRSDLVRYDPGVQTWRRFPDYWVGWESLPGPEDLRRDRTLPGYWVRLGDGREWLIPVARLVTGEPGLERVYSLGEDGKIKFEIQEKYRELYEFGCWWMDQIMGENTDKGTRTREHGQGNTDGHGRTRTNTDKGEAKGDEEIFGIVCKIIGVNYRVGPYEISVLQLVTDTTIREIMRALVDLPGIERILEAHKKKAQAGESGTGEL